MSIGTLSIGTLSIGTLSIGTLSIGTLSIGTLSIGTLSIAGRFLKEIEDRGRCRCIPGIGMIVHRDRRPIWLTSYGHGGRRGVGQLRGRDGERLNDVGPGVSTRPAGGLERRQCVAAVLAGARWLVSHPPNPRSVARQRCTGVR
jgi:hypothetical protein